MYVANLCYICDILACIKTSVTYKTFKNHTHMDAIEALITRQSVKKFIPNKMPSTALLNTITQAATYAPSGMGRQSAIIIEITNAQMRNKIASLNAQFLGSTADPFYGSPVIIAVLANKKQATYVYDGTLVMANILTAAHALGLGACWIHRAKEVFACAEGQELLAQWGIEGDYEGIGFCALGYREGELRPQKPRKENYIYKVE